eukprot:scpid68018/ scgid12197/ Surfeit locus protein 1
MLSGASRIQPRAVFNGCGQGLWRQRCRRHASTVAGSAFRPKRKIPGLSRILALSVIPITCTYLGNWQVRRMKWKEELIKNEREEQKKPAVDMPHDLTELSKLEWKKVRVRGEFDHSREQFIGPRPLMKPPALEDHITYSGYIVLTPFRCAHNGQWILVNRGWVTQANKNPKYRLAGQVEGEVEIVAKVRKGEKRPTGTMRNSIGKNTWTYKDLLAISAYCKTGPYLVDVVLESSTPDGPIGGQTPSHLKNKHLEYVVTWYGIAIVTGLFIFSMLKKYMRQVRRQRDLLNAAAQQQRQQQQQQLSSAKPGNERGGTPV